MRILLIVMLFVLSQFAIGQEDCEEVDKGFKIVPGLLWTYNTRVNQSLGEIRFHWSDTLKGFPKDRLVCVQNLVEKFVLYYDGNRTMMELFKKDRKSYFPKNITKYTRDFENDSMPIEICGDKHFVIFEWVSAVGEKKSYNRIINLNHNAILNLPSCSEPSIIDIQDYVVYTIVGVFLALFVVFLLVVCSQCLCKKTSDKKAKQKLTVSEANANGRAAGYLKVNQSKSRSKSKDGKVDQKIIEDNLGPHSDVDDDDANDMYLNANNIVNDPKDNLKGEKVSMSKGAEGHWHVENVDSGIDETSDDTESKMKAEKSLLQKGRKDQWRMKNLHNSE